MTLSEYSIGDGPNLTLVPGWGLGSAAWKQVVHMLADNFTVHVVDLPGYGDSPASEDYSLDALADALAATLPPRAMLCGWSLGAMICVACAARHPRKVARMVLTAATASFIERTGWPVALPRAQIDEFIQRLEENPENLVRRFAALLNQGDIHAREAARALRLQGELPASVATLRAGLELLGSADLRELAPKVFQPTLLVHGSVDPLMPVMAADRLSGLLYQAHVEVFEGSAHAPFASDPERFVAVVNRFAGITS